MTDRKFLEVAMDLRDWLAERQANAENLARLRPGDGPGWLEDADYFRRAVEAVDELARFKRMGDAEFRKSVEGLGPVSGPESPDAFTLAPQGVPE